MRYYGDIGDGRAGSLYRINDQRFIIAMELYKNYLCETGQSEPVLTDEMCKRGSERRAEYEEYVNIMRQLKG